MRIAYCAPNTFVGGGMERVLANKANWLADNGYEVTIITTDQQGRPPFFELSPKVRCLDLGVKRGGYGGSLLHKVLKHFAAERLHEKVLRRVLMQERFDVVVSMMIHEVHILPHIKDGSRKVAEIHNTKRYKILSSSGAPLRSRLIAHWQTWRDGRAVRRYDRFVVLTEQDRAKWRGVEPRVIYNATSFLPADTAPLINKQVIALGRLAGAKRFDRLIEAWHTVRQRHPDWSLKIYGDGEFKVGLEAQIARMGGGNPHAPNVRCGLRTVKKLNLRPEFAI